MFLGDMNKSKLEEFIVVEESICSKRRKALDIPKLKYVYENLRNAEK